MMRWNSVSVSSTDSASSVRLGVSGEHRPLRMPQSSLFSYVGAYAFECHNVFVSGNAKVGY